MRSLLTALAFLFPLVSIGDDASFLLGKLLKPAAIEIGLSDLGATLPPLRARLAAIRADADAARRLESLREFPISDIMAAPGHRLLRNPTQVDGLVAYVQSSGGGNFVHDKLLLNIVTDSAGRVVSVDLWNAHHRMVAYLRAGFKTVGELNPANVEILVNGTHVDGRKWGHFLPAAGVDLEGFDQWSVVPPGGEIRVGTISVDGAATNFALGSRNTVGQLYKNTFFAKKPRVGVYFGTFDPIHEGHVRLLRHAMQELALDEVVVVPNKAPASKPGVLPLPDRAKMLELRLRDEPGLNVYTGDVDELVNRFDRDAFIERIGQTYGTHDIHQLVGQDRFEALLAEGKIRPGLNRKYAVFPRGGAGAPAPRVPAGSGDSVFVSSFTDVTPLSSTYIRNQLKLGQNPAAAELDSRVLLYIRAHGLYR